METGNAQKAFDPVRIANRHGKSPFVLVCDHASNFLPAEFGTLGLPRSDLVRHIAWDPGAAQVARTLSKRLDAPLVESCISRLVIDCNRPLDAPDLIWTVSETTEIPGNQNVSDSERERRIQLAYNPFHNAIDQLIRERLDKKQPTSLISIHSFTPIYKGVQRPWQIGILHDDDTRLSAPLIAALRKDESVTVGDNEPYSPADRVYFTLERHGGSRGLPCAMIEIRNDEIADADGQDKWALRLADILHTRETVKTNDRPGKRPALSANS